MNDRRPNAGNTGTRAMAWAVAVILLFLTGVGVLFLSGSMSLYRQDPNSGANIAQPENRPPQKDPSRS